MELLQRFVETLYDVWLCIANRPQALKTILYVENSKKMVLTPPTQNATKIYANDLKNVIQLNFSLLCENKIYLINFFIPGVKIKLRVQLSTIKISGHLTNFIRGS